MICTEFYNGQGLGNQLWDYVVTRILADKKGWSFSIIGRKRFKGREFMDLDFGPELIGGSSPEGGPPISLPNGIEYYYREKKEVLRGTDIDITRTDYDLLNIQINTKIDGNYQSVKYLEGYRDRIKNWLKIKADPLPEDVCVINFRGGEYTRVKDLFLPQKYWDDAVENMRLDNPHFKFLVITDDVETAKKFFPDFEVKHSTIGGDYSAVYSASYLIIANTSFAFFPAWTGRAKKVIAPKYWAKYNISNGYWSTSDVIAEGFTYLDRDGKAFSAKNCWREKDLFESTHPDIFQTVPLGWHKKSLKARVKGLVPNPIKDKIKASIKTVRGLPIEIRESIKDSRRPKLSSSEAIAYRKTIKIYDIFIFFNELDLLELRLNILDKYVDYFVIVESTQTFTGTPKKLYFEENKKRFGKWLPKIIHYVVTDTPKDDDDLRQRLAEDRLSDLDKQVISATLSSDVFSHESTQWLREFYQKESMKKALTNLNDNDICFISDVDEIWNPNIEFDFTSDNIFKLKQLVYVYYLNNRSSEPWAGTIMAKYKNIKNACINYLDNPSKIRHKFINNGGWHFTSQGGADQIRLKLESYGHQEFNNDEIKNKLEEQMASNRDFIGRRFRLWKDESDLPEYLIENKEKYSRFFK